MPQHLYKQLEEEGSTRSKNQTQREHTPCHPDKGRDAQRCQ